MSRPLHLLFVCSGNICRSPMAAAIARAQADELGLAVRVRSAGTLGILDAPADPKAVRVCRELGLDLTDHRSQGLSDELIAWADHVLVMEFAHAHHLREYYPSVGDKLLLLGQLDGSMEIPDPIGAWTFRFRRVRKHIERCVRAFLVRVAAR